jgi:hypothetical protein
MKQDASSRFPDLTYLTYLTHLTFPIRVHPWLLPPAGSSPVRVGPPRSPFPPVRFSGLACISVD